MLIIAKGRPIEIKCYFATETDGNDSTTQVSEVSASLAGTACIVGADYITAETDVHGEEFYRLRFVKWYTIKKFNPCAYALRLRIGDEKIRLNDIFSIDTYPAHDNTGLPPGDTVKIKLTIRRAATGAITWAEDITVPGTLECIRVNGGNYFMDEGVITLPDYPDRLSQLEGDSTHRTVTDAERQAWNGALEKISPAASRDNQLADKNWVGQQVATASATFRGTNTTAATESELITWANQLPHDENDYVFWQRQDQAGNNYYSRYKFNGEQWLFEYNITSTSFTAEQWAAINSGITEGGLNEIIEAIADCATIEQVQGKLDKFSLGAHDLPVWFDSNKDPQVIDALHVPGDIKSGSNIEASKGVSAKGIADLSVSSGGGGGTLTLIKIGSTPYPDDNGVVTLPVYPAALSDLSADSTHRVVTDSQISAWTGKYDKPGDGIPLTDLASAVQTSLGKADSALQQESDPVFTASPAHGISSSDITSWSNAVTRLGNLITGLTSKGAHNLPIYLNANAQAATIDSLSVPGDIESTGGGVSAKGIASLALASGSQGTLTQIILGSTPIPDVNGVVTLPAYPTAASLITDGLASRDWVSENYAVKSYEGRVQTIESFIPAQATSINQLADKAFVNSSISTATATFKGTVTAAGDSEAQAQTALASISGMDINDYAFVKVENTPQTGVDKFKRYKYTGSVWSYEYTLNNSSFTSDQWTAINSGITGTKVTGYDSHLLNTSNPHSVTKAQVGLGNVENTALSTWAGTSNITTLGTIATGKWQGTAIADSYIASASTWNNAVTTLTNLKTGLTSKGAHDLPVYLNSSAQAVAIDALSVPGDIQSTAGGVSARGIADLSISSGGGGGTLTQIILGSTPVPDVNGVVTLPAYPTTLAELAADSTHRVVTDSQISAWTGKYDLPSGGIPKTDLSSAVQTSLGKADSALQSHQTIYSLIIKKNGTQVGSTYNPATAAQTIDITDVASANALSTVQGFFTNGLLNKANHYTPANDSTSDYTASASGATASWGIDVVKGVQIQRDAKGHIIGVTVTSGKIPAKPTYAFSDLTSHPTDLAGYGITDGVNGLQKSGSGYLSNVDFVEGNNHSLAFTFTSFAKAQIAHTGGSGSTAYQVRVKADGAWSDYLTLQQAGASAWGIVTDQAQSFGGDKTFNGNIHGMKGVSAKGIASLQLGSGGAGSVTGIKFGSAPTITDTSGILLVSVGQGTSNGQINIGGQDVSVKGLGSLAYLSSYAFADLTSIPTTIAGYGITDAKISNGVITLGGNTITPLTSINSSMVTTALGYTPMNSALKGANNGVAELGNDGKVPSSQLPSYVDDVLEYSSKSAFPSTGETGKIYVALDTNLTYRWSGTAYVEISPSLALGETSSTAYRGDRGKTAYDHATDANRLTSAQTSGFYKFATTAEGHIKSVTAVTASDLTTLIGSTTYAPYNAAGYLPLSGGTISSGSGSPLTINTTNSENVIKFQIGGANKGWIGYSSGVMLYNYARGKALVYKDDGTLLFEGNTIWHAGNDGTGSGLDADLLDGTHKADLFSAFTTDNDQLSATIGGTNKKVIAPYASLATDTRVENLTNQSITYRQTANGGLTYKPTSAVVKRILGNSVVWNVLTNNSSVPSSMDGFSYSKGTHNSYIMNGSGSTSRSGWMGLEENKYVLGHYYYVCVFEFGGTGVLYYYINQETLTVGIGKITQITSLNTNSRFNFGANGSVTNKEFTCICIDLTLFFNGNIPTGLTAETFERDYGYLLANPSYNAGSIINNACSGLESTEFNLWDEEWEVKQISGVDKYIESKNFIRVSPNSTYYFKTQYPDNGITFYDINHQTISSRYPSSSTEFTTPSNCSYIKISTGGSSQAVTTYNHDICINKSDSSKNGTYEPYRKNTLPLRLKEIKVKSHNIWDEEWEVGDYNNDTGAAIGDSSRFRTKNYIPVKGGASYYFKDSNSLFVFCYTAEKTLITGVETSSGVLRNYMYASDGNIKTMPVNCAFIRFKCIATNSYNPSVNPICINESSSFNGRYEPHGVLTINGVKKAGSVYDEIVNGRLIVRVGEVDLGSLSWETSWWGDSGRLYVHLNGKANGVTNILYPLGTTATGDDNDLKNKIGICGNRGNDYIYIGDAKTHSSSSAFISSLNGVYAYYELATPIEYELADDLPYTYAIDVLGTEAIPEGEQVAPFIADIQYGAKQTDIAYDIDNLAIGSILLRNRATTLEGYFTNGIANNAARLSNTSAIGSGTKPVYFTANGVPSACSDYAGGTAVTLNGSSKAASTASFYAPTGAGTAGQILKSTAGTPEWINQSALVAGKATQLENSRSLWGQSFNGTADIGTDKYAKMPYLLFRTVTSGSDATIGYVGRDASNNVIHLTSYSGVPVSIGTGQQDDLYITTGHNVGIGTTSPSEKLHVIGNILSSGNIVANGGVAARGMASLQGGAGTGNPVTQINVGTDPPYTPTNGVVSLPAYPTWSTLSGKPTNVSAFTNDSGYIDSSALAVTYTTTTLTSSSTSVYLNNTVQRDTLQKITISSANNNQTFTINLTGSGSYYGYHRQVLVINNSGKSISLQIAGANYIYIGAYDTITNQGPQRTNTNPIAMDNEMNAIYFLDVMEASSSEYPIVKVTHMDVWAD